MYKKIFFSWIFLVLGFASISQEKEYSLTGNPSLYQENEISFKRNSGTFDSTFVYITDTLLLPFFDEFSTNKFQTYNAKYTDLGVSSEKFYVLKDASGTNPLPANSVFALDSINSFKRYVNVLNNTVSDTFFAAQTYKVGSLKNYPVTYNTTDLYPAFYTIDTLDYPNPTDTVFLVNDIITQDSATQFFKQIVEPSKLWLDNKAYHNYRFAINPWTLGVATFDGLDEYGRPYVSGIATSGYADVLTSKPIDLKANSISDSIYLSFLYQPAGWGEQPEANDSLVLEFWNAVTQSWDHKWSVGGRPTQDFKPVHIPVVNSDYFQDYFQFRLKNYGSLAGALDHFHVDYINLRAFSTIGDTLFKDFAFVYPITTLLKDYTSVPWDHYKNSAANHMANNVQVSVRNGSNQAENYQNGAVDISHVGLLENSKTLQAQVLAGGNINYGPRTTYFSEHDFSIGYQFDKSKMGTKQIFDIKASATAQFTNPSVNDTARSQQYFGYYYSYDDGTAERAYGPTGNQARLAIRYTPYEADSLIGALIHFVPSVVDATKSLFVLTVWADNNGKPGSVLYEDNLFFPKQPIYETSPNGFTQYFFKDTLKVRVNGTFYIGWRQFDGVTMNVGLDKNIDKSNNTFYSVNGGSSWNQSQIPGSVMIRPIFSTAMNAELGLREELTVSKTNVIAAPNPTNGQFVLISDQQEVSEYQVFNLQGKLVLEGQGNKVDLTYFESGMYLVKTNVSPSTIKITKK
ncbi:MAG: T9SS type A sorting domain-containing protein [Bacteroidetes bacterium]|nr:T9SS type A sorting domain-containing protein [Bacteroidota bacterium]